MIFVIACIRFCMRCMQKILSCKRTFNRVNACVWIYQYSDVTIFETISMQILYLTRPNITM